MHLPPGRGLEVVLGAVFHRGGQYDLHRVVGVIGGVSDDYPFRGLHRDWRKVTIRTELGRHRNGDAIAFTVTLFKGY